MTDEQPSVVTCKALCGMDDDAMLCGDRAEAEVLGTSGEWEPWCSDHVIFRGIPKERVRMPEQPSVTTEPRHSWSDRGTRYTRWAICLRCAAFQTTDNRESICPEEVK